MMDTKDGLTVDDFIYFVPTRRFVFLLTGQRWVRAGVDAALPPIDDMPASTWLMRERSVWWLPKR